MLKKIQTEITRASNKLISINKLYQSDEPQATLISINALIQQAIQVFENHYPQTIKINTIFATPAPDVLVDDLQLELLIFNLFKNAYESMQLSQSQEQMIQIKTAHFFRTKIMQSMKHFMKLVVIICF